MEIMIDDLVISKDFFDKTIEELGISENDAINIKRKEKEDGTRIKHGCIWVLNSTEDTWTVKLLPKTTWEMDQPSKATEITGPNNTIPVVEIDVSKNGKLEPLTE